MNPIRLPDETHFSDEYARLIEPALSDCRDDFFHVPEADVALSCEMYRCPGATACVVIVHGFTESAEKFRELAWLFLQQGYSVLLYDQRGHGCSTRLNRDPDTVYVRHFDDYVRDLASLVYELKQRLYYEDLYLYAHSMGGCVAARALERYPLMFKKCVLNAPMIAMNTKGVPTFACKLLADFFLLMGQGKRRFFGHKPYSPDEKFENSCTTSHPRFDFYAKKRAEVPQYTTTAASYRWIREALRAHDRVMRKAALDAICTPILVFRAEHDFSVDPDAMAKFVAAVPCAQLVDVPNVRHEIYRSPNADLLPYLEKVFAFFEQAD